MTALDDARQAALAVEHRAVFTYGVLGPRLGGSAASDLGRTCQRAHEQLRDDTQVGLRAAGGTPVAPAADYPGVYAATTPKAAVAAAIALEMDAAAAWHFVYVQAGSVPASDPRARVRDAAQTALTGCAVRATQWRTVAQDPTPTVPFPGI